MAQTPRSPNGRPTRVTSPTRPDSDADTFTSEPVTLEFATAEHRFVRADIEIAGLYHGEASYEGRVFINNPAADRRTPLDIDHGYAGSFYVLGHGGCLGDPGHCEVNEENRDPYDLRRPHALTLAKKRVTVTDALRRIASTAKQATITIVPVVSATNELCDTKHVFRCEDIRLLTYN
jgi:tyrosinase